jgi:hypothetical protein
MHALFAWYTALKVKRALERLETVGFSSSVKFKYHGQAAAA